MIQPKRRSRAASPGPVRYRPSSRLLQAYNAIADSTYGLTIAELQQRLGVGRHTVWRLLQTLSLQFQLYEVPSKEDARVKRWRLAAGDQIETLSVGRADIVSLFLTRRSVGWLQGTGFYEDLESIFAKLEARLRKRDAIEVRHLDRKIFDRNEEAVKLDGRVLSMHDVDALVSGLLREECLELLHTGVGGGKVWFEVHPLTLLVYKKNLYLICDTFAPRRASGAPPYRVKYGLDGVRGVRWLKGKPFVYPATYRPQQVLAGAFGIFSGKAQRVRVRFTAAVARLVKRTKWHYTQRFAPLGGGEFEMTMRVYAGYPNGEADVGTRDLDKRAPDLERWILGFGRDIEVLEPPALRLWHQHEIAAMGRRYGGS